MAAANRAIGKDGYVSFDATEISADYQNFDVELTIDTIETSAGDDASKSYITTLKDGTAKLTYAYTGTAGSYASLFKVGTEGALLWGAEGNGSGKPKGGANAIVVSHSKPMAYNELIARTVTFQFTGDLLFDDEEDTWS